jgi:hypothetical protein
MTENVATRRGSETSLFDGLDSRASHALLGSSYIEGGSKSSSIHDGSSLGLFGSARVEISRLVAFISDTFQEMNQLFFRETIQVGGDLRQVCASRERSDRHG